MPKLRHLSWIALIALATACLVPSPARATLVTFATTHLVTASTDPSVAVGDRLVTTFTLDTEAADLDPDPHRAHFVFAGATPILSVRAIGGAGGNVVVDLLDLVAFEFDILTAAQQQLADEAFIETSDPCSGPARICMLLDFAPGTFVDGQVPATPPDLHAFLGQAAFDEVETDNGTIIGGTLLSFVVVDEPPGWGPAAILLLASCLVARERRSRRWARART
jgi:hypothetical protein